MLADRTVHGGEERQFGIDGIEVAHVGQRARPVGGGQFTQPPGSRTQCDTSHLVPVSEQVGPITRNIVLGPNYGHGTPCDDAR